jgi:hypothetical protein
VSNRVGFRGILRDECELLFFFCMKLNDNINIKTKQELHSPSTTYITR